MSVTCPTKQGFGESKALRRAVSRTQNEALYKQCTGLSGKPGIKRGSVKIKARGCFNGMLDAKDSLNKKPERGNHQKFNTLSFAPNFDSKQDK